MMERFLPANLRLARMERGLTLRDAAKQTGVTTGTLSDLERGLREPHPPTLYKIAQGYGIPVRNLLQEAEPATPLAQAPPPPTPSEEDQAEERRLLNSGGDTQGFLKMFELVRQHIQAASKNWEVRKERLESAYQGYTEGSAIYLEAARLIDLLENSYQVLCDHLPSLVVEAVRQTKDALLDELRRDVVSVHDHVEWLEQFEATRVAEAEAYTYARAMSFLEHYRAQQGASSSVSKEGSVPEAPADELAKYRRKKAEQAEVEAREAENVLEQIKNLRGPDPGAKAAE